METQTIEINKEDNSTELQLKSDKNINYEISIYYKDDKLYFKGISKDTSQNKIYESNYILNELVKTNSFFFVHKNIKEVYEELDFIVKKCKDSNNKKLFEKIYKLIIIFPINTLKIKECQFEINEIIPNKDKENIMTILKERKNQLIVWADDVIRNSDIYDEENEEIKSESYNGQIAAFSVSVALSGLKPAVALYYSGKGSSDMDKKEIIKYAVQLLIAILTAVGTTLGVTSCI